MDSIEISLFIALITLVTVIGVLVWEIKDSLNRIIDYLKDIRQSE